MQCENSDGYVPGVLFFFAQRAFRACQAILAEQIRLPGMQRTRPLRQLSAQQRRFCPLREHGKSFIFQ